MYKLAKFNKLDVPHQWKDEFTKYPHGYSIFGAISKWVKQVNDMITNINQWNEYLGGFTSTFGEVPPQMEELKQEMAVLLNSVNSDLTTITDEVTALANTLLSHLTDYATYLESELGEEHIIRTLPNGVKDEFDLATGKLIKRIKTIKVTSDLIVSIDVGENITRVMVNKPQDSLTYNNQSTSHGIVTIEGLAEDLEGQLTDDVTKEWLFNTRNIAARIRIGLPLHINTLEKAREQLAGRTLTYQLAEPEIIDLPEVMSPNTREIVRLSEQVDKLINML